MSAQAPSPSGRLRAGTWSKVYWAWGTFVAYYLLSTDAGSVEVRWYGTVTAGIPIPRGPFRNGEEFGVPVVGYTDLWFRAETDAVYRLQPKSYGPLPIPIPIG